MSIKIIKAGLQATIQDTGRYGFRSIGIGSGGAMDLFAVRVANYLTGNGENDAVIELNFPAPEIGFQQNAVMSLTGADFSPVCDDHPVKMWEPFFVKEGSLLQFKQPVNGSKAYLAVTGGWEADEWLGSRSTHLTVGAGGHLGRALQKNDIVLFKEKMQSFAGKLPCMDVSPQIIEKIYRPKNCIRCVASVEWNLLSNMSQQFFINDTFGISLQSDRIGYRLKGTGLALQNHVEIISSAVDEGTIQLLPDGNLIVLTAAHQTTGGYPRIASVIKADLPKFAQLKPGDSFNFKMISVKEAEDELISMMQYLDELKIFCSETLYKC